MINDYLARFLDPSCQGGKGCVHKEEGKRDRGRQMFFLGLEGHGKLSRRISVEQIVKTCFIVKKTNSLGQRSYPGDSQEQTSNSCLLDRFWLFKLDDFWL